MSPSKEGDKNVTLQGRRQKCHSNNKSLNKESLNKKESPPDGSAVSSPPPEAERLCDLLLDLMKKNNDRVKFPTPKNKAKWIDEIHKMNRLDGYSWEEIENMIRFSQAHKAVWSAAIRSGTNLRKHREQLFLQMNNQKTQQKPKYEAAPKVPHFRRDKNQEYKRWIEILTEKAPKGAVHIKNGQVDLIVDGKTKTFKFGETGFAQKFLETIKEAGWK